MDRMPRSINAIVEEQVQRWQAQRSRNGERARGDLPAPLISVSRQYGARGAELGRLLAERLGFAYWNRELLAEMARHAHGSEAMFAAFDEHHRAAILDTLSGMMRSTVTASDYYRELSHAVHGIAGHGAAVVVGRGVQFMLDPASVLRIRVVCPIDIRVRGLIEREGVPERQARLEIEDADRDRREFVRDHYGRDLDDPAAYDLWLNTGTLTLDGAAAAAIAAYHARFPGAAELARHSSV